MASGPSCANIWLDTRFPKVVEFVAGLPREDSGKIFKRKLRAPDWRSRSPNLA